MLGFSPLASAPLASLPDFGVKVSGVAGQGFVGSVLVRLPAVVPVTGLSATAVLGTATPTAGATTALCRGARHGYRRHCDHFYPCRCYSNGQHIYR